MKKVQHANRCNMKIVQDEKAQHRKIVTRKECNTKKVQYEQSATSSSTRKGATRQKVQHEKGTARTKRNMKRVQYENIITWKKCNPKSVQHEKSAT